MSETINPNRLYEADITYLKDNSINVERAVLGDEDPRQCDNCIAQEDRFDFYSEGWFVEGNFYCNQHIIDAIETYKEIVKHAREMKTEREEVVRQRKNNSGII